MTYEPEKITREHVLKAIERISTEKIALKPSRAYEVIIDGKPWPPKEVLRYAHLELGQPIDESRHNGGERTNRHFERLGFKIRKKPDDSVRELVERYKKKVRERGNAEETYKWQLIAKFQRQWNLSEEPLHDMIARLDFGNLVYYMARRVLIHIATEQPEAVREAFSLLYTSDVDLKTRVEGFAAIMRKAYTEMGFGNMPTHQDERTIATYLAFMFPEQCTFYKASFYEKLLKLLGEKRANAPHNLLNYYNYVRDFIDEYILPDSELLNLKENFLQYVPNAHSDPNHWIFAQDILYQSLDLISSTPSYWRIGASQNSVSVWTEMRDSNTIAIGWNDLGDLDAITGLDQQLLQKMLSEKEYPDNAGGSASRKAGEIWDFYRKMMPGDIAVVQVGDQVVGIGRVTGDYEYAPEGTFHHRREVQWLQKDLSGVLSSDGRLTTVFQLTKPETIAMIKSVLAGEKPAEVSPAKDRPAQLNVILYGPPGTGKTYNSIDKAFEIIEGYKANTHEEARKKFNELLIRDWSDSSGQIAFVTFHQSLNYEQFIEGIKAETVEAGQIKYWIEPGIFTRLCSYAQRNWLESEKMDKSKVSFEDAFNQLKEEWEENPGMEFSLKTTGKEFTIFEFTETSLWFQKASGGKQHSLSIATLRDYFYGKRMPKSSGLGIYYPGILQKLRSYQVRSTETTSELKNYVLIIDEINRGNVSQIFGELITLLEEDKRLGKDEALEATLPYSKESFGVPPNLYIIGTMNTADRSVEALDTALRRRFSFVEMAPDPQKLTNVLADAPHIKLSELLSIINTRLEKLLDRDHLIGHSYFMKVTSLAELRDVFYRNIIPLLQEYFYGDYAKCGLVLGRGFVQKKPDGKTVFADADSFGNVEFSERAVYIIQQFQDVSTNLPAIDGKKPASFNFASALANLMHISSSNAQPTTTAAGILQNEPVNGKGNGSDDNAE